MIEVRMNVNDMPLNDGPDRYFDWVEARLKAAGVPVDGDKLLYGTLSKFDDPNDFGSTTYRWEPNVMIEYKGMSADDKAALKELQEYAKGKTGVDVKLADIIAATTPGFDTPEYLRGV